VLSPPWDAVIAHVPGAVVLTVVPDTMHTRAVPERKNTGSPDEADADNVAGTPTLTRGGWRKVIVCALCPA
jgi:hypothetical protein